MVREWESIPRRRRVAPDRAFSVRPQRPVPRPARDQRGQSLVDFSLVLMPLFLILLGIIQFGSSSTRTYPTNAARDAARTGTI